ncbi:hydroxyisourate hydrolase [Pollutimonas subterranea]|uniref:5-hydroxyisourate hydrolase n=1 Tax=Pollutimonas subterranea TaxID=2045210 RepID=A0A2N4U2B6_9BURK|nr:hydroxyisourate hydrolase [Pollutimonas subterranea]PLC49162.1 hydroxyisourate hydrolase [Pollutimonas subterranea]
MGKLTTHVLDTLHGLPAQNVQISFFSVQGDRRKLLKQLFTNGDGRCDEPLLQDGALQVGVYELVFHAGDYFAGMGIDVPQPRFVDKVAIRFGVAKPDENYHVPLVVTPWAWSTYRGS